MSVYELWLRVERNFDIWFLSLRTSRTT